MHILGPFALLLTLCVVHATEYFREQFLDAGESGAEPFFYETHTHTC